MLGGVQHLTRWTSSEKLLTQQNRSTVPSLVGTGNLHQVAPAHAPLHCLGSLKPENYPTRSSSVQSLSHVRLFVTPWTAAHQASLSITNCRSLPKPMSIESVMSSNISSSVVPFSSCPQSFPASGSFQMSQLFASGGQTIGSFNFNISPSNEHPGLISFRMD